MKEFNFYNYVTRNKGRKNLREDLKKRMLTEGPEDETPEDEFDSSEFEKEPSKKDIKQAEPSLTGQQNKASKLNALVKQKDELIQRLKAGQITIDQYRKLIGSIPQQIKTLTADIAKMTDIEDEEEPLDEYSETEDVEDRVESIHAQIEREHHRAFEKVLNVIAQDLERKGYDRGEIAEYLLRKIDYLLQ